MICRPQRPQQSLESLIAALQLFPLHRKRMYRTELMIVLEAALLDAAGIEFAFVFPPGAAPFPKPSSASASKKPGSFLLRTERSLGRRRLAADRIAISQDLKAVDAAGSRS